VGVTVETRQTSIGALETNLDDQFQSLQSIVDGNSNSITDLEMSSSAMGVTVEILQTSIDALDINLDGQLQTLNETVGGNSTAITTLSDDIDTRFTHHRNALGDLGLGLGLVGVTIETLQTNLDALAAISLPDLAGYALETYVDGAVAAISLPDLAGYALETYVDGAIAAISLPDLADPALEAHVNAIDARVEDNSAAIVSIENKLVVPIDDPELVGIDQTSVVINNNSPVYQNRSDLSVIHAFDGNASTRCALNLSNGVAFTEFDMGAVVTVSGFRMKPDNLLTGFPRDTRLYLGQSRSGPWGQIGRSVLAASPSNENEISFEFTPQSYRYFRVDFRDIQQYTFAIFRTFTLLTTQTMDVFEHINTRISQLESALEGAVEVAEPINLSGVSIVSNSPHSGSSRSAANPFDSYLNPYNEGFQGVSLWNTISSIIAFVVIDTQTSIRVGSVTFYSAGNPGNRCPKKFDVFSRTSGTGPWTLQGTANWEGAYPPTTNANQPVLFANIKTAQFWRLEVSGHVDTYSQLSEAVFSSPGPESGPEPSQIETRVTSIEDKLVVNLGTGELLDPNSYVATRSSSWYQQPSTTYGVYNLFDGDPSTFAGFIMDKSGVDGVAFAEFEMGEVVHVSGFRMKPRNVLRDRFPWDTRLFSGPSSSGPWTQIGTSILATSPSNDNNIIVEFPSASARYFRAVFTKTN